MCTTEIIAYAIWGDILCVSLLYIVAVYERSNGGD